MFSRKEAESFWAGIEAGLLKKLTGDSTPEEIESLEASVIFPVLLAAIF
jgi:hypothetical protein